MQERTATCRCGGYRIVCRGEPVRVSICHCLECKKRSGSAFAYQARWPHDRVQQSGTFSEWTQAGDSGGKATFRFCPTCGVTVSYVAEGLPDMTAVAVGAFAEPTFQAPDYSVYETRKHAWLEVTGEGIEHYD